jgi:hypothetical protein
MPLQTRDIQTVLKPLVKIERQNRRLKQAARAALILATALATIYAMSSFLDVIAAHRFDVVAMAQTTQDEIMESTMAHARIIAARKAASAVTTQQCLSDLSSWEARDNADEKTKVDQPNWWYQKLSTEELVRLSSESPSCSTVLRHAHRVGDSLETYSYGKEFDMELLFRAEDVLTEHHLMHEYLLKASE